MSIRKIGVYYRHYGEIAYLRFVSFALNVTVSLARIVGHIGRSLGKHELYLIGIAWFTLGGFLERVVLNTILMLGHIVIHFFKTGYVLLLLYPAKINELITGSQTRILLIIGISAILVMAIRDTWAINVQHSKARKERQLQALSNDKQ